MTHFANRRRRWIPLVLTTVCFFGAYPGTYAALRVSGVMTHCALWVSQEGYCGGTIHFIEHDCQGSRRGPLDLLPQAFAPLVAAELAVHRRRLPPPPDPCE